MTEVIRMPWHISIHPDFPIVETCYSGVLSPPELSDSITETLAFSLSHGLNLFLGDCTQLVGGHSVVDLYFFADALAASAGGRAFKEAVILPSLPGSAENVRFWETTCYNRGLNVRIFSERESAIKWLME